MRQSKFTKPEIVSILKETDAGHPVNEIWRTYDISSAPTTSGKPSTDGRKLPM